MTSRRQFLQTVAGGTGLAIAVTLPAKGRFAQAASATAFTPNAFVRITPDDLITVVVKHAEMGQGVSTSLPMIVADEMDADWSKIRFAFAPADPAYNHTGFGAQITGGSTSVSSSYQQMRQAGATAREMLKQAAAEQWGVDVASLQTRDSHVIHKASDRKITYGKLADAAAAVAVPQNPKLKNPSEFRLIGKPTARLDSPAKTDGTAQFGLDVILPDMVIAVVARPPIFGAKVKSFDGAAAKAKKGVHDVVAVASGVAVIADDFWTAKQARETVTVVWDDSGVPKLDSESILEEYVALADTPGAVAGRRGDAAGKLAEATEKVSATFSFPFLAHAPMEPMNCVAQVTEAGCEIWAGTQFQTGDQMTAAAVLGIDPAKVKIHTTMLGGGFGRRANKDSDFVGEAVRIAKKTSPRPVKVVWTREDDTRGGYYRPMYVHKVEAGIDGQGNPSAWHHRIVGQSIMTGTPFEQMMVKDGIDPTSVEGAHDMPYQIPDLNVEYHLTEKTVPTLWWRSVGHTHTAFVSETVLDELATMGKRDPVALRRSLLSEHPRHAGVLALAVEKASWGKPLEEMAGFRRGRGVALHESFQSVVAQVADVSVAEDGSVRVDRVVCAIDCGRVINPRTVEAQMQSGIVYGLTAALYGRITLREGRVQESNFHDYQALRMNEMPKVEVYTVETETAPTGVGEPATPVIAPAVCNAIAAATGVRIRSLPIDTSLLKM